MPSFFTTGRFTKYTVNCVNEKITSTDTVQKIKAKTYFKEISTLKLSMNEKLELTFFTDYMVENPNQAPLVNTEPGQSRGVCL